jgi:hypothetical protein
MQLCPSDFTLDDLDIHHRAVPSELAEHFAHCPRCTERRARRSLRCDEFRREMAGQLWPAIERRRGRFWRWRLWLGVPTLAVTAAVALFFVRPSPRGYTAAKGPPEVEVICRRNERTFTLTSDHPLAQGDELRFRPRGGPPSARYIVIGSVDGSGRYVPFYPPSTSGFSVPLPAPGEALPGGILIDDVPGPERLLIVLSAQPIPVTGLVPLAEAAAGRLGAIAAVAGQDVVSAWQVLIKNPTHSGVDR